MVASAYSSKMDAEKNLLAFVIPSSEEETSWSDVLEPPQDKEKTVIWKSYVLLSFCVFEKLLVFLGTHHIPKSRPQKVKYCFPCYLLTTPPTFEQRMLDLKFLDPSERVFRSAPTLNSKEYNTRLDKVQRH